VSLISEKIKKAKIIVWNGPTGWYEKGFTKMSIELAKAIKDSKAFSIIGGGDTGAVVDKVIGENKKVFVSTGGGATLEYLSTGTLVGISVLK
jgi:phosphoglycerate kinase